MLKATKANCHEEDRIMKKFYSFKTLLKVAGGGKDAYAAYSTSAPGCIMTKDRPKFKRYVLN